MFCLTTVMITQFSFIAVLQLCTYSQGLFVLPMSPSISVGDLSHKNVGNPIGDIDTENKVREPIVFTCTANGGILKWFKNNTEITEGVSTSISDTAVTSNLTFYPPLDGSCEVYECQVDSDLLQTPLKTSRTSCTNLNVQDIPPGSPIIEGPDILKKGETIVLTCSSSGGSPTPTVKWFRDYAEITNGISTLTFGATVTTTYTFVATLNEHFEVFECQADNGVLQNPLKISKFVYLHFPPDAPQLTDVTRLAAGDPGTWECTSANGYPPGTMTIRNTNTSTTFTDPEFTVKSTPTNGWKSYNLTGTLKWTPALTNNQHQLCCEVAHPTTLSTPQSVCLTLHIRTPLAVNAPVTSYTPTIGATVILQCVIISGNITSITWFKGSNQLNVATYSRYSNGDVTYPSLTISSVQQSDAGDYICLASDGFVNVSTSAVNVSPQGTPPVVTMQFNSYTKIVGYSVTLACQVSSPTSELQNVQWVFMSPSNHVTDPIVIISPKYSGSTTTNPSLTINNVQFSDEGTYRCRATNLIGTTNSANTAFLDVQGTLPVLTITHDSFTSVYGKQLVINCTVVSANPSVTNIFWTRWSGESTVTINNGDSGYQGSTPQNPSLTINYVLPAQHTGTYRCHGTNDVGTGSSNQTDVIITGGLLTINQSPASANILHGSSTTITCIISGTPSVTSVTWLFTPTGGSQGVLLNILNKHTGGTMANPNLTISYFQSTDAGTYGCQAMNTAGTTTSSTSTTLVYMEQLALLIRPVNGSALVGDETYVIDCQITGVPPATSISWHKQYTNDENQHPIIPSSKYTVTAYSNNPVLTISDIAETDGGDYFCSATNPAGTVTSTRSRLIVKEVVNAPVISIPVSFYQQTAGNSVTLICQVSSENSDLLNVQWSFIGHNGDATDPLQTKGSTRYSGSSPTNPSLTINNVQLSDQGTYRCQATNLIGTTVSAATIFLDVYEQAKQIQHESSTILYSVISFSAVALVILVVLSVVCWRKRRSTECTTKDSQKEKSGTYQTSDQHIYHNTDDYDDIQGHEHPIYVSYVNVTGKTLSSGYMKTSQL